MSVVITWESFMSQLVERGQVTVPVLNTEMSTPCLLAFTVWPATPQLDSLQAVTSLARGSRSFQSLPAYLRSSDLTRASEPTINLQSMTSFCVQRLTGFEKALEQLGSSPWTLSLGSVERKQGSKHKPWTHALHARRFKMDIQLLPLLCMGRSRSKTQPRIKSRDTVVSHWKELVESFYMQWGRIPEGRLVTACDLAHLPHEPRKNKSDGVSSFYVRHHEVPEKLPVQYH